MSQSVAYSGRASVERGATELRPARERSRYLSDLDGLRALAVVPVMLFHAGADWMPGGFVGVDVFFVLSGFFITRQLLGDIDARQFSIGRFYERRARRILPALFFVLAVTTILASLVLWPVDLISYATSLLSTLVAGSNVYFWADSGYFAQAARLKPLLHTWSLAVEEQFYIAYPIFLWLLVRLKRVPILWGLAVVAAASFALSAWGAFRMPSASFYLVPMRAWELLIGGMLALPLNVQLSRGVRNAASLLGLAMIVASVLFITEQMPFPGAVAALPCVGTGLVVLASVAGGSIGGAALSLRPIVFIGQISYSLYLWHWPLLALSRYALQRDLRPPEAAVLLVATLVFSALTWRFVEQPFRQRSRVDLRRLLIWTCGGFAVLSLAGAMLLVSRGLPARIKPQALAYFAPEPEAIPADCFGRSAADVLAGRNCLIGAPNVPPSFVIWGDSHADRAAIAVSVAAKTMGRAGWYAARPSCPPLVGVQWPAVGCADFNRAVLSRIRNSATTTVILSGFWEDYVVGRRIGDRNFVYLTDAQTVAPSQAENARVFRRALLRTVDALHREGKRVVVLGPIPELGWSAPALLAKAAELGQPPPAGPTLGEFLSRQADVLEALRAAALLPGVTVTYLHPAFCGMGACAIEAGGRTLYLDDNHLSNAGVALTEPTIVASLRNVWAQQPPACAGRATCAK